MDLPLDWKESVQKEKEYQKHWREPIFIKYQLPSSGSISKSAWLRQGTPIKVSKWKIEIVKEYHWWLHIPNNLPNKNEITENHV